MTRSRIFWLAAAVLVVVGARLCTRGSAPASVRDVPAGIKRVTTVAAIAQPFQPTNRYVGTIEPWIHAKVGPQLVSAYVDTVLVRPGAIVKQGEVIATLDCRNASALSKQIAAQARAVDAMSSAADKEASRISSLDEKYVSENEVDQKKAAAATKQAEVAALKARMVATSLQVDDCVLRAPFDGEIAARRADPGTFVRPGSAIATIVDRHVVRVVAEVPEQDFEAIAPGTAVRLYVHATDRELAAKISRRAPAVNSTTRTARIEIDVEDGARAIPVWTTADVSLDIGAALPATAVPLAAASVHAGKATMFVARDNVAHQLLAKVVGEHADMLYVDAAAVPPGTVVVVEGRSLLADGDPITVLTQERHL